MNKEQITPVTESENDLYKANCKIARLSAENVLMNRLLCEAADYMRDSKTEWENPIIDEIDELTAAVDINPVYTAAPDMYEALEEIYNLNFYEGREANIYFHVGMNDSKPEISTTLKYIFNKIEAVLNKANGK